MIFFATLLLVLHDGHRAASPLLFLLHHGFNLHVFGYMRLHCDVIYLTERASHRFHQIETVMLEIYGQFVKVATEALFKALLIRAGLRDVLVLTLLLALKVCLI